MRHRDNNSLVFTGIIPARYSSTRFPGKPLADILGKPMFWHVYQQAVQCRLLHRVYLATDDERIYQAAGELRVPALMTSPEHHSGTDRIMEAARQLGLARQSVVVNIQGDEPALEPKILDQLLEPFVSATGVCVTTPARRIDFQEAQSPNTVKVVISQRGRALYFSRSPIPWSHDGEGPFLGHIGLYAYRYDILEKFQQMEQSFLEQTEKLEQLRLLEAGIPIDVVVTRYACHGVDVPEDISRTVQLLQERQT
ncbi:3-deoxy-D-manno-octulosonate cytidylyltransferase [Desulfonatronospira thiodismutans ASO3-1]|uniref:3-deoxy-manno-octulosonate cytidylyltransferase n=1 Tax=Desulfonatronospira thiodismutans ASO3-1 TaxID=555779 RepID=D6SLQ6_9BACT|nr:3-deoxy-manno-octulosonate cytidylyltransferase [Desulfonatronospira thiodismutans]EFI35617.1 3-deoxy-D-manno-octulosonate cytidylyltransferase [Desulfonatronospira thiodismutans ASO3-1]